MPLKNNRSFLFDLIKTYVKAAFKSFYGEYIVLGKENIPAHAPLIFAPNHLNALMDALAVHTIVPSQKSLTFLARSDIFRNRLLAKFLTFIKIMPAFRMRDGVEQLAKNKDIFDKCVHILHQNQAIGIMPEGNQGEERKLRLFSKGIFRIAFAAQQPFGNLPGVKIIPVGLHFGSLVSFGKAVIINIGKPIEVSDYMDSYNENAVAATNRMKDTLRTELSRLTLDLASHNFYPCFEYATEIAESAVLNSMQLDDNTLNRFQARQQIAQKLLAIENGNPHIMMELNARCNALRSLQSELKIPTTVLDEKTPSLLTCFSKSFVLMTTSLVFLGGFILNFLPFFLPVGIRKQMNVEYKGFYSSIHFGIGLLTFPLFYCLQTLLLYSCTSIPWWGALIFFVGQYYIGKAAFYWFTEAQNLIAAIRFNILCATKKTEIQRLLADRKKIIQWIV